MRVRDLLGHKVSSLITVEPKAELETAILLLVEHDIGGLPVLAPDGAAVGFLAERDVVRAVHKHQGAVHHLRVMDVMRPAPLCEGDDSLEHVMRMMTVKHLRHLAVRDNGRIIGVISIGDIVKHRLEQLETEAGVLRDYVAAQRASR
jgi:CBS domain-containing protein